MKRIASTPLKRQDYPPAGQIPQQALSTPTGSALQEDRRLTPDTLRDLPVPPFPPDADFSECAIAAQWANQGMPASPASGDVRDFALLCVRKQYSDALSWMVLHHEKKVLSLEKCNLCTDDFIWLLAWANDLPCPIRLELKKNNIDVSASLVADAIAQSTNLVALDVRKNRFSESSMAGLFAKLKTNTVLRCLGIDLLEQDENALNEYLRENCSLDTLYLQNANHDQRAHLDIGSALLANKTLERLSFRDWYITDKLGSVLFGPHETLASLCFEHCRIYEVSPLDGPDTMFDPIASNSNLSTLTFRRCDMEAVRYENLVQTLYANTALASLRIEEVMELGTHIFITMLKVLQVNTRLLDFVYGPESWNPELEPELSKQFHAAREVQRRLALNNTRAQGNTMATQAAHCLPIANHASEQAGELDTDHQGSIGRLLRPPFPPYFDVDASVAPKWARKVAAQWMRDGMPEDLSDKEATLFAEFCIKTRCADALTWMVLRHAMTALSLFQTDINTNDFLWLMAWVEQLRRPITLDISATHLDLSRPAAGDAVGQSKTLTGLIARGLFGMKKNTMACFLAKLIGNTSLTRLSVEPLACAEEFRALSDYLQHNDTLSSLYMGMYDVNREEFIDMDLAIVASPALLPGLSANNSLTSVELFQFHIDQGLIRALFSPGKKLTTISFEYCIFSSEAVAALAEAIFSHKTLSTLELVENDFPESDDTDFENDIITALQCNQSITTFRFEGPGIHELYCRRLLSVLDVNSTVSNVPHFGEDFSASRRRKLHSGHFRDELTFHDGYTNAVRRRLDENRKAAKLAKHYPLAESAFSILPGSGLATLPLDVSKKIVGMLPAMGPSALSTYRTLHRLSVHKLIQAQTRPSFPAHLNLALTPLVQKLATEGRKALPVTSVVLHHISQFCIRHQAEDALNWLVVHTPLDALHLSPGLNTEDELRWLLKWMRSAPPCQLKLTLEDIRLDKNMAAILAKGLRHNNTTLTGLSVKHCAMQINHLMHLLHALQYNDTLQELALPDLMAMPTYTGSSTYFIALVLQELLTDNRTIIEINMGQALSSGPPDTLKGRDCYDNITALLKRNRLLRLQAQDDSGARGSAPSVDGQSPRQRPAQNASENNQSLTL